ncbi:MAG TPA: type 1 fimbrial protein [Proteus sp.]|uniref:Type 1 fimbriae major subunit n=1 Tax=Proteus hauseri ATCC 700826 TaxID=1354271 RepID=A0AAJ3LUU0_PROHU|nr:fimbrial protein [Proteus hauseri]OAT49343.1 type 1 fimbriae major subunit [Proteus hauseri ATCC 700826]QAV23322.1 type 1 fimbrial protein [Proteus hauseri]HCH51882.1 type 1 fimbrial protein [Proteus sp. (in: enterobacteria)]
MSKLNKSLYLLGMSLSLLSAPAAFASGTINFTGEITDQACTVDSTSKNLTVDLGKVSSKSLATKGEVAGLKDFTIKLVDCPVDTTVAVRFGGTRDAIDSDILAIDTVAGGASNVGIALFEKDAVSQINLYADSKEVIIPGTEINLDYVARYKATAKATPGPANSSAVYSIQYK